MIMNPEGDLPPPDPRPPLPPPRKGLDVTGAVCYSLFLPWIASLFVYGSRDLWPIAAGVALFQGFNWLIQHTAPALLPRLQRTSLPLFTNTAVSLLHSSSVGLSVAAILLKEVSKTRQLGSMFEHEELFGGVWQGAHNVLCFSCGYFVYDQLDMLRKHLYNPLAPSLLVHHVVLLVCFTMALYRHVTINYLILTLLCELHSIFLHLRRVLRMAGVRNETSHWVKLEWNLNWLTFFTTRIFMHIFIILKLFVDASKFPKGIELPLAILGMVGLNVLNSILGLDLFKAYKKEKDIWKTHHKET